jgi:hypothetical protein
VEPSLTSCGTVGSHHIFCNDIFRTFQVDEWTIKLSLREYLVMHKLTCGQPVSAQLLLQEVYGNEQAPANEEPLSRLLERLRKKLRPCGLVIRRITQHGYHLTSQEEHTITT